MLDIDDGGRVRRVTEIWFSVLNDGPPLQPTGLEKVVDDFMAELRTIEQDQDSERDRVDA